VWAAEGEPSVPYLRPYDTFDYLPVAADHLSRVRTENLDALMIRAGDLLVTCSGRNLADLPPHGHLVGGSSGLLGADCKRAGALRSDQRPGACRDALCSWRGADSATGDPMGMLVQEPGPTA
jgi:hypothetical protein